MRFTGGLEADHRVDSSGSMRPETAARVATCVEELRRRRVYRDVLAVVVCGSAGRGEDRPLPVGGGSDIDLMVITASRSPFVGRRIAQVLDEFRHHGIEGGQIPRATLRVHRTLLNYEARCNGTVVDGERAVLEEIPMRGPADIPQWEAVRLLFNRLFEHIKLSAGLLDEDSCIAKTYEAIGEAQLVLERRYRPSFAERWEEVRERPLPETIPRLQEKYLQTAARRIGATAPPIASVERARTDLLQALSAALGLYTGLDRDLQAKLAALSRQERNWLHRVYWIARSAVRREPILHYVRTDPSLVIWRDGLDYLTGRASAADPVKLVLRWQTCPQILRPRVCP
jgi:predicted nucleotidyltransferase